MNELVEQLAARAGSNDALAEKKAVAKKAVNRSTAAIILGCLRNKGATDKVHSQIDRIPGAETAVEAPNGGGERVLLMGDGVMALGGKLIRLV